MIKCYRYDEYPCLLDDDELVLNRQIEKFGILYNVYMKKTGKLLGTCQVLEREEENPFDCTKKCNLTKCKYRVTVREWGKSSIMLRKKLGKIQHLIRENL